MLLNLLTNKFSLKKLSIFTPFPYRFITRIHIVLFIYLFILWANALIWYVVHHLRKIVRGFKNIQKKADNNIVAKHNLYWTLVFFNSWTCIVSASYLHFALWSLEFKMIWREKLRLGRRWRRWSKHQGFYSSAISHD